MRTTAGGPKRRLARSATSTRRFLGSRLRRRRGIFGGGQRLALVDVGLGKLIDRPNRPLLKTELAVLVQVELRERLSARLNQLGEADPTIFIMVGAGEAF